MISLIKFFYLIVILFAVGDVTNGICFKDTFKKSFPLRLAIAYTLGTGTISLLLFYLSYLGGTISFKNVVFLSLPLIIYFIYNSLINSKWSVFTCKPIATTVRKGILDYFFLILIIASLCIIFFRTLYLPMHLADECAQWGIKAKILYHEGTIYAQDFFDPSRVMYHASYPFLVPLLESIFYSALGEINDRLVKIPFPIYFLALLLFFYASQKRWSTTRHALMFTTIVAVLPVFISNIHGNPSSGYADVPLTLYYTISAISLFFWIKEQKVEDLLLATVCITFAIFTKKEGLILWGITILGLVLYFLFRQNRGVRTKAYLGGIFVLIPFMILLPWFHFYSTLNIGPWEKDFQLSYLGYEHIHSYLYRVPLISKSLIGIAFTPHYFNVIWVLFFAAIVFSFKNSFSYPQALLLCLLALNIAALFLVIVVYPWFWWKNFLYDMPRLLMVNIPIATFFASYQLHKSDHR